MICIYLGNMTSVIEIFEIPGNSDDFMLACVTRNACLTLHIYLLSKLSKTNDARRFIASFINWCSQMRPT